MIAGVLEENRLKPPRVVTRLLVEAIEQSQRRSVALGGCVQCREWEASLGARSIREQSIQAAKAKGRLEEYARFLSVSLDRTPRRAS